ncbi:hypothetical protein [Streptomyces sp. NBC_00151]|uniref:hypothetical protein n=1 Tax=Streptomyces sp. NBC_00151 TaxID=2975669 RepID=UPI002DDABD24|nr:hypothetical protein [Streptomyces sp. NBC_00151]WRZ44009.1 hypothetical protein OG915_41800 [Streptomyces sp. NBC_00151]
MPATFSRRYCNSCLPGPELKRQVAHLDAVYVVRTLPDPFADRRQWRADLWWRRRLTVGGETM